MPTIQVSQLVLSMFDQNEEYGIFELLDRLKQNNLEDADIKEALAYLISDHQLEFTLDRRLKLSGAQAQVHA